jgi:hypothetical protein
MRSSPTAMSLWELQAVADQVWAASPHRPNYEGRRPSQARGEIVTTPKLDQTLAYAVDSHRFSSPFELIESSAGSRG